MLVDLVGLKESFHRVAAEAGQRRLVEIGLREAALLEEDLLDGTEEADLIAGVAVEVMKSFEGSCNDGFVVWDVVELQERGEQSPGIQVAVELQPERLAS